MAIFNTVIPVTSTIFDTTPASILSFSPTQIVVLTVEGKALIYDGTFSGLIGGIPQGTVTTMTFASAPSGGVGYQQITGFTSANNNIASIFSAPDHASVVAYLTSQDDAVQTASGSDTMDLGAGNDMFLGSTGTNVFKGGAGDDTYYVGDTGNTIVENANDGTQDVIYTSLATYTLPDNVELLFGSDVDGFLTAASFTLYGNDLNNGIIDIAGAVNSTLSGMGGNDQIQGRGGDDALYGGDGNDTLYGDGDFDGDGNDTLYGDAGSDILEGGAGNDTLVGNADIFAQESDTLNAGAGQDTILGEFTDVIDGGDGVDTLIAVNSYDWSIDLGATSIEWMLAGFGNDTIDADSQLYAVTVFAGGGNDTLIGSEFGDFLWGETGNDIISGGNGSDVIVGDVGVDSLSGGDGNDQVYTDGADSLLDGGAGTDILYVTNLRGLPGAFAVDLAATGFEIVVDFAGGSNTFDGSAATVDTVVFAGNAGDIVKGGSGSDFLWGEAGNDTITGGSNSDTLVGGTGSDTLTGGTGNDTLFGNSGGGGDGVLDTFIYNATGWGTDFIYDFEHATDKIDMQGTGALAGTVTISNIGGNAHIHFGGDVIVVVGVGATLTTADFIF